MKKKPLSIKLIALCFFLAPVGNLFQIAYFNHWPLTGPRGVANHLNHYEWIILGFFPVVAWGVFRVAKWGYWLCVSFLAFLILNNTYTLLFNEKAYSPYVVILFQLVTLGVVGFFLNHHIAAPYFNPKMRWWETRTRYRVNLRAQLRMGQTLIECQVLDISAGGCFVSCQSDLSTHDVLWMNVSLNEQHGLTTMAEVVWVKNNEPLGYGLAFKSLQRDEKKALSRILLELKIASKNSVDQDQKRGSIRSA